MSCSEFHADLSPLADNALEGQRAVQVRRHLHCCSNCRSEFEQIQAMRSLLAEAGRVPPPENLALTIRIRISQEASMGWRERLHLRVQNLLRPLAVPVLAGFCSAFFMFAILTHTFAMPAVPQDDVPLYLLITKPSVSSRGLAMELDQAGASMDKVKSGDYYIQVSVGADGSITDYRFLTPVDDPATLARLRNALVFTRFNPATIFGVPRASTTILSYNIISIKG